MVVFRKNLTHMVDVGVQNLSKTRPKAIQKLSETRPKPVQNLSKMARTRSKTCPKPVQTWLEPVQKPVQSLSFKSVWGPICQEAWTGHAFRVLYYQLQLRKMTSIPSFL